MMPKDKDKQKQTLHDRGICVVIPTYNNGGTIAAVVRDALRECRDVIVVNDGSTDNTPVELRQIDGITLVEYATNRGKGYALRAGFRRALEMGFSYAITLDGDGQHYSSDISLFLTANQKHPGALIIGSRQLEGVDRSGGSKFANKFSNFWFYLQTGRKLDDTQSGYRLYPLHKLYGLSLLTSRYEAELELMVFASWHGVQLVSIPIDVYYPSSEERVSHFRPGKDFARISVLNTILCFLAVVYGLPLRLWRWIANIVRTVYSLLYVFFFCFCIITPAVWVYVKIGHMTEKKRYNLHRLIYHSMRFIMLSHGIPGTCFTYNISDKAHFFDQGEKCDFTCHGPSVIICNHQSHIDLACQLIFSPRIIFPHHRCLRLSVPHLLQSFLSNGGAHLDMNTPFVKMIGTLGQDLARTIETHRRDANPKFLSDMESTLMETSDATILAACSLRIDCNAIASIHQRAQLGH